MREPDTTPENERELAEWRAWVGRAILAFGDIEFVTVKMLAHIPRDSIVNALAKLAFGRRVDLLIEILRQRGSPAARETIEKLKHAKVLAEVRNIVAHNPLLLDVFVSHETGDTLVEEAISSARSKEKSLDLAGLKEFAGEVESMSGELYALFARLQAEGVEAR